ncbi:MAG: 3-deoxy-manno-octulosonate-8-phosphatase KdsC [Gammaproteobacteria bacterium]|nr:3-deoxy-manno-octulosonate-8-phosphatase KdsC [Gammaproteobacteria bacterium]
MEQITQRAKQIRLVIFDVDGVLTDGSLIMGDDGQEYKAFNAKDGHGMKMLQASGVEIGVISARNSRVVSLRMENLGIKHVYQGQRDKLKAFADLLKKLKLEPSQIAYVGDDLLDLCIMRKVGLAIAVQDASPEVVAEADWQTTANGGRGAAREICEMIMQAQGTFDDILAKY